MLTFVWVIAAFAACALIWIVPAFFIGTREAARRKTEKQAEKKLREERASDVGHVLTGRKGMVAG